jgi:hypothetical protein
LAGDEGLTGSHKETAAEKVVRLEGTDAASWRTAIKEGIEQIKERAPVRFEVDARVKDGGKSQAEVLYDEMKAAFPKRDFQFWKPELKPGDPGYKEFPAFALKEGTLLSTKENQITLAKPLELAGGLTLPEGSKFSVGTIYEDGKLRPANPDAKVTATTPDGTQIDVPGASSGLSLTRDNISADPTKMGQVAGKDNFLLVRSAGDAFPINQETLTAKYEQGSRDGIWAPKATPGDHFKLPENVTVGAKTDYGDSTASGAKSDYYMRSGFADAQDATGTNYTGKTDPRAAQELLNARADAGLEGMTQAEAGLIAHAKQVAAETGMPFQVMRFGTLEGQPGVRYAETFLADGSSTTTPVSENGAMRAVAEDLASAMPREPEESAESYRSRLGKAAPWIFLVSGAVSAGVYEYRKRHAAGEPTPHKFNE